MKFKLQPACLRRKDPLPQSLKIVILVSEAFIHLLTDKDQYYPITTCDVSSDQVLIT